jgi:hypothetical protein
MCNQKENCNCPENKEYLLCGCDCHNENITNMTYEEQLKIYRDEAYEYFSNIGISPCPEEIVEFVCECVEENSGCEVDDEMMIHSLVLLKKSE